MSGPIGYVSVGLILGLIIGGLTTGLVWATTQKATEVRLAARVLEDGRVEVALQQRSAEALDPLTGELGWDDQILPRARFLASDATPDQWYQSTPFVLTVPEPAAPTLVEVGPFQISGTPTSNRPFDNETLFCVITHGERGDFFWFQVFSALLDAQRWNDINLRTELHPLSSDQALAINQCVEDGAAAIATTLADPDALKPALEAAAEAGVRVISFNSGADLATDVGSAAHVALDETSVGEVAAAEFARRVEGGDLLCILHEPINTGLEERCNSLEANYNGGDVLRVRLADADDGAAGTILSQVGENVVGALALNANTAYAMADALSDQHPGIVLAAVTADFPRPLAMLHAGRLSFVLWSHALEQGYLTTTSLLYAHGSPFPPEIGLFGEATQVSIQPTVITAEAVQRLLHGQNPFQQALPAWFSALERAIAAESESSDNQ